MITGLSVAIAVFCLTAAAIGGSGVRLAYLADRLADRTGWGEAVMGAAFLGGITSLGGTVVSVTAAAEGHAELAISNAIGGIAVQTFFLVVGDALYRRANLEHAAASSEGLIQIGWLMVLLSAALFAASAPPFTILHLHPVSALLPLGYLASLKMAYAERRKPMWFPRRTRQLRRDTPGEAAGGGRVLALLWVEFAVMAAIMGTAGFFLERTAIVIAAQSGLSHSAIGALMTSTVTSLPELVITVAAVRRGALSLAVGGIVGGNSFDVLFLSLSDAAYFEGSLYHAPDGPQIYLLSWSLLMAGIVYLGLIKRQASGPVRIGYEGIAIAVVYGLGVAGLLMG